MVYAPGLYKEASFGLWAGVANTGTVWSPALWSERGPTTVRLDGWRWSLAPEDGDLPEVCPKRPARSLPEATCPKRGP